MKNALLNLGGHPPAPTPPHSHPPMVKGQCRLSIGSLEGVGHLDWDGLAMEELSRREGPVQSLVRFQEQLKVFAF